MTFTDLYTYFQARIGSEFKSEKGQTMAEYGVILAVISVLVIVALTALSGGISNAINAVRAKLP